MLTLSSACACVIPQENTCLRHQLLLKNSCRAGSPIYIGTVTTPLNWHKGMPPLCALSTTLPGGMFSPFLKKLKFSCGNCANSVSALVLKTSVLQRLALLYDFTVVTSNVRDFSQVPNLTISDWAVTISVACQGYVQAPACRPRSSSAGSRVTKSSRTGTRCGRTDSRARTVAVGRAHAERVTAPPAAAQRRPGLRTPAPVDSVQDCSYSSLYQTNLPPIPRRFRPYRMRHRGSSRPHSSQRAQYNDSHHWLHCLSS